MGHIGSLLNQEVAMKRERFQDYTSNGKAAPQTFSAAEMQRRLDAIRGHMAHENIDAALFTSHHCVGRASNVAC